MREEAIKNISFTFSYDRNGTNIVDITVLQDKLLSFLDTVIEESVKFGANKAVDYVFEEATGIIHGYTEAGTPIVHEFKVWRDVLNEARNSVDEK